MQVEARTATGNDLPRDLAVSQQCWVGQPSHHRALPHFDLRDSREYNRMSFFTFFTPHRRWLRRDVEACGEAEQTLASKFDLLSTVLENVAQGVAMFDATRRLLVWNDEYQQIVQFPDGFLQVGLSIWEMSLYVAERGDYGEGDPEKLTAERLNLLWSGEDARSEITMRGENIYDVLFRRTDDGGLVITFTDITERKRAEEALRASEQRLANAQRLAHLGHWDWDIVSGNLYMSDEASRIYGFGPQAFPATLDACFQAVHPDDRDRVSESVHQTISSGQPFDNEFRILRPDGTLRHVHERGEASFGDDSTPVRMIGTVYDITERKEAEEALQRAHDELEIRILERTSELRREITERKLTEEALRESEERFRSVVNNSPTKIHIKDVEGRYVLINSEAEKLFGLTNEEARGKTSSEIFPNKRAEEFKAHDQAVLETGQTMEQEEQWELDGSVHTYLTVKFPIRDGNSEIVAIGAIGTDITERKEVEEALKESEARLSKAAEMAKIGYWIWDEIEGKAIYCSEELAKMYGIASGAELAAMLSSQAAHLAWVHPDDQEHFDEVVRTAKETKRGFDIEYRIINTAGKVRHLHAHEEPVLDERGEIVRSNGITQDITERKRAEEALRESEARLSKAAEMAKIGYWVWDAIEGKAIYCSNELGKMHGVTSGGEFADLTSSHAAYLTWVHPDDQERFEQADRTARETKRGYDIEYRIVDAAGKIRHLHGIEEPVLDERGKIIRSNGITQDITEQKRAEEQLRQSQKLEAVGQLTGGVAHDFNNLLAVILGNAELVADRLGEDDKQVGAIVHAATRGAELTQRLLSFSRQQALRPQTVDLNACVTGMTDMLGRTLGETIEIEPILASGLSTAEFDPGQLESALLNLAVNARDAMPKGGRLTIETANIELDDGYAAAQGDVTPGHYVRLSVTDTGTGIPPENIDHVFEPFFTTKEVGEGSGLGLSMVFGFAKQSGGHVTISSEPGCGTTVQLYLPQAEAPAQPAGQEPAAGDPEAQGETVLVVEDDPDVRSLVISLLQRLGYNILEAGDGAEALAALQASPCIDLLLSDVVLPGGVSGPDLVEQVADRYPGMKVLLMSGYPDAPHRRGPLLENTELLGKPFGKRDLARKVRAVLNG